MKELHKAVGVLSDLAYKARTTRKCLEDYRVRALLGAIMSPGFNPPGITYSNLRAMIRSSTDRHCSRFRIIRSKDLEARKNLLAILGESGVDQRIREGLVGRKRIFSTMEGKIHLILDTDPQWKNVSDVRQKRVKKFLPTIGDALAFWADENHKKVIMRGECFVFPHTPFGEPGLEMVIEANFRQGDEPVLMGRFVSEPFEIRDHVLVVE